MRLEGSRLLSPEEVEEWMDLMPWRFAKTMPAHPHSYCLKRLVDPVWFEAVVLTIWLTGYDRWYLRRAWRSLDVGDYFVWVCTRPGECVLPPIRETILINRAERVQERLL